MGALGEACIFLACVQNLLTYHIQYTACIFHMGAWGGMTRVYFVSYGGHVGRPIGQSFLHTFVFNLHIQRCRYAAECHTAHIHF